jgi:dTDP-4-dehydrorhamnose reductase
MRVLILGAAGMLGHKLCQTYRSRYDTWATVRKSSSNYVEYDLLPADHLIGGVDAFNIQTVINAMAIIRPDVVINCIGIIKQLKEAKSPITSITINSLFPHQLHTLCQASGARLIHISTDCVFAGHIGMYTEDDIADAEDLYGRSKYLGEVSGKGGLTLRSSIIGRELSTSSGLIEWFLSNDCGSVKGFRKAIYSGFTTQAMATIIADMIDNHPELSGMYQVSSKPINKYDLLVKVRDAFDANIEIEPYDDFILDRSLDSSLFRSKTSFTPPAWDAMLHEMASDPNI